MTERCSSLVHVASGAAIFTLLLRLRVAFLQRTATRRPLFKPLYHCCQLTEKSSVVSNFFFTLLRFSFDSASYNPFKVMLREISDFRSGVPSLRRYEFS
jgi:hypothetical protein